MAGRYLHVRRARDQEVPGGSAVERLIIDVVTFIFVLCFVTGPCLAIN